MRSTARLAVITILACIGARAARAQQMSPIARGGWILGGAANISRSHDDVSDLSTTSMAVAPYVLRFVASRLAVGGGVTLGYSSGGGNHETVIEVGPSARYFFGDLAGKTFPFVSATIQPGWSRNGGDIVVGNNRVATHEGLDQLLIDGSVGVTHTIASNVGLTGEAFWSQNKTSGDNSFPDRTMSNYGLRFGFTIFAR
jgi:hypothetical protein